MLSFDYRTTEQVGETRCQRKAGKYICVCGKGTGEQCVLGSTEARNNRAIKALERDAKRIDDTEKKPGHKNITVADADIHQRSIDGAVRWAKANSSDPFAFSRAMTHIRMGIARPKQDGGDGGYNAETVMEQRHTATGEPYMATAYRNIVRP